MTPRPRQGARLCFRPHHFLCTYCFRGEGYSPSFTESYAALTGLLSHPADGDSVEIRVVEGPDAICGFCPRLRDDVCETQEKVTKMDATHARVLGLEEGQLLTWGEAKERLAARMTLQDFDLACEPCGWKALGICREALRGLIAAR